MWQEPGPFASADLGEQTVKNIANVIGLFGLGSEEIETLPEPELPQSAPGATDDPMTRPIQAYEQEIQFCVTPDGVQLAYARTGSGPPLVKTGNWMTHLEFDFESRSGAASIANCRGITR